MSRAQILERRSGLLPNNSKAKRYICALTHYLIVWVALSTWFQESLAVLYWVTVCMART